MEFRILGPLEVVSNGEALDLGGQKQRALLAVLLLNANEVVSSDRLIEALWQDEPPDTAQKAVQVYVSQLRKLLGRERLQTRPPGYLLRVDEGELDLARFRTLRAEGRPHEALSIWRGPPLGDFAYQRFAQAEIARLEEQRLACFEERVERYLAAGLHADLVGELEGLVADNPLRERLRRQLMLALYRSGRQAEALDAYQEARTALVDELGIEPSRELRELHQAILNQDPALDLIAPPAAEPSEQLQPPSSVPAIRAESVARAGRRSITALYIGLTTSSERRVTLDPETLRRVTSRASGEVNVCVARHGGRVETVAADGITAIFGLPTLHEDDAFRAMRAAADTRNALSGLAAELESEQEIDFSYRIGVSTGEVVVGGDVEPQLGATGQPLTISSGLARDAMQGEIILDAATRWLVRDALVTEPANDAWRLLRLVEPGPGVARRFVTPMVGRDRERRRLRDAFEQAVGDGACQLFTVLGVAGVGKSRLVEEVLADVAGRALVARGRCLPYGEGITFWPLLEAVKEAVGLVDSDSPEQAQAKLAGLFGDEQAAEHLAQRLAETIGLADVSGRSEEGFESVRALFDALARIQPLVVVFDDIHWGEATFLDLVEQLADWLRDAPIFLLCLARPELLDVRPDWGGGKLNATAALLEPLSHDECSELIKSLVGQAELAEEVATKIADAAEGNPLFVEEMFSMLIEDGLLVHQDGRWRSEGLSAVRVPPTIQALLAARLDQLDEDERAVIERAAVQGKFFNEGAVADLMPETLSSAVPETLGSLMRKELIRAEGVSLGARTYRFRHLLICDAAYDSISKEARADLHERFGRWLERTAGDRATEYEEVLGYHFERAYWYRVEAGRVDAAALAVAHEAAERLGSAGRRAFGRGDGPAGVNLISRAVALLPADNPLRVALVPNLRVVQGLGEDMTWADRVLTDAVEVAATTGDRRLAAHALVQRGFLRLFTESEVKAEELIETADRSIDVFEELRDDLGLARAWRLKAQAHYLARRGGPSADASESALEFARRAGDRFEEQEIVEWLVIALFLGPAPAVEAIERCELLLEQTRDSPHLQVEILGTLASLVTMQGRTDEAHDLIERGRTILKDMGEWVWVFPFNCALVFLWQDNAAAAEQELRPPYDGLKKIGEKSHFSSQAQLLSNAVYLQGRFEEAELLTRECEEAARPNDVYSQIIWRAMRAKILARRGEFDAAREFALAAVAFAAESDFHHAHAEALMDLAEVHGLAGEAKAAAAAIEEAIHFYELKGDLLAADRARTVSPSRSS